MSDLGGRWARMDSMISLGSSSNSMIAVVVVRNRIWGRGAAAISVAIRIRLYHRASMTMIDLEVTFVLAYIPDMYHVMVSDIIRRKCQRRWRPRRATDGRHAVMFGY